MIGPREARKAPRPAIVAAALLVLLVTLAPRASRAAVDDQTPGPCALIRGDDERVRPYMKRLIRCAAQKWEVSGDAERAICIARRESGLDPKAMSPNRLYRGLFQHHKDYWPGRYDKYTRPGWELSPRALNGRTAAIVSVRMAHVGGWGPWKGEGCS